MNINVVLPLLATMFFYSPSSNFNGELAELECPDDCDCHYFRVNWVTDCSDSHLSQIPYGDISSDVYILDLNDNKIEDIEPFLPDMKMRRLQVADNLLTRLRRESFVGLHYLIDADFSGNKIVKVDPDVFLDSPGFITLELQGNPLEAVQGPFVSIKSLLYLDISNCGLTYLNPDFFADVLSLSALDLSGNPLQIIKNDVFKPLASLETLKMTNCNLTFIDEGAFESFENLKNLELSENKFVNMIWPSVLKPLVRLEHLDLRKSGLVDIPTLIFYNNAYLRTVVLSENALQEFDVAGTLGSLQHLDTLDLSHCNLTLPLSEDAFINATKIRSLYLSGNPLFASDLLVALAPLTELQKLSLSNCGLTRLPNTFHNFKSLHELDISHNPLNDAFVKLLSPLDTLEYLNMGYSNLSHLAPSSFSKMTSMRHLILSGNDLHNLEAGLFGNLTNLESLDLNFCGLMRTFNATVFFTNLTYTDLTELNIAGNPLTVPKKGPLLPKQLSRLKHLDMSNCNLTFLPVEAFYWTQNVTKMILSNNRFGASADFHFLELLPKLELLDLRHNNLTRFTLANLEFNPSINKLKLIGNAWRCECYVADLWDWAKLEKNDLSILEGLTVTAENIKSVKSKGQKMLTCSYDHEKIPLAIVLNKTAPGRRGFKNPQRVLTVANRTWAKYVRESGCEQYSNLTRSRVPRNIEVSRLSSMSSNDWGATGLNAILIYGTLMILLGVVMVLTRSQRTTTIAFNKDI